MIEELTAVGDTSFDQRARDRAAVHLKRGTEEQKRRYLRLARASGRRSVTTEPGGGSDPCRGRAHAGRTPGRPLGAERRQDVHSWNGFLPRTSWSWSRAPASTRRARHPSLPLVETKDRPGYRVGRGSRSSARKGQGHRALLRGRARPGRRGARRRDRARLLPADDRAVYERTLIAISAVAGGRVARGSPPTATRASAWSPSAPLLEMQNTRFVPPTRRPRRWSRARSSIAASGLAEGPHGQHDRVDGQLWTTDLVRVVDDLLQLFGGYGCNAQSTRSRADVRRTRACSASTAAQTRSCEERARALSGSAAEPRMAARGQDGVRHQRGGSGLGRRDLPSRSRARTPCACSANRRERHHRERKPRPRDTALPARRRAVCERRHRTRRQWRAGVRAHGQKARRRHGGRSRQ